MHDLEQETASAAVFIINAIGSVTPYYWEVPQSFNVPAVFFPAPVIETGGDSLGTYRMSYSWFVKFFHKTDGEAQNLAQKAIVAIKNARNCLPLYEMDGRPVGKRFRVLDPSIRQIERGTWQMELRWNSARYYTGDIPTKAEKFKFVVNGRGDIVPSKEYMSYDATAETDVRRFPYEGTPTGVYPELEISEQQQ